jgi:predicted nucleic acid-binding protein
MLLDTNAISAWAEQEQGFLDALRGDRPRFLPSIALGEYRFGVVNSTRREALEQWLDVVSRDGHFDNVPGIRRIGW